LRIPPGKLAKVFIDNKPEILVSRDEAYTFNSPYFRLEAENDNDPYIDQSLPFINHGTINVW
jgi:hypothetical protein